MSTVRLKIDVAGTVGDQAWRQIRQFDDIQSAAFHNPSLTTIRQPLAQMGTTAARILLQRIRGQATFPDFVSIHPELVIRESSSPPNAKRSRIKRT